VTASEGPYSRISVEQVDPAAGWTLVGDTAAAKRFPNEFTAQWPPGNDMTRVDQIAFVEVLVRIQANGGPTVYLGFGTPDDGCPGRPTQASSPVGLGFPGKWTVSTLTSTPGPSGCGYVAITNSPPGLIAQFLVTSSAGVLNSEKLPAYVCRGGKAVPTLPSPTKGFGADPSLATRAALVARKSVRVACADSPLSWASVFHAPRIGTTIVGASTAYFEESACRTLRKGPTAGVRTFARVLLAFAHEAEHMRGIDDERAVACAAFADLPKLARAWGIRSSHALKTFMAAARSERDWAFPDVPPC
jgi:hypothetical protein